MIFKLALVCAVTVIVNNTDTWTARDQEVMKEAQKRCGELFPDAPCLKKIVKNAENSYRLHCGEPFENND